jgi:hypothetical protein
VFTLPFPVDLSRLARLVASASLSLVGALALVLLVDEPLPAHAAQTCTTLPSQQVYCLTKLDAIDPIRVGEVQLFTIVESLTGGTTQVVDAGALTDIVPANYTITNVAATLVGSATGPACTLAGNTVSCPGPRTIGPGAGQLIVTVTALARTPSTKDHKCEAVNNTATTSVPGITANSVSEGTIVLPEKGSAACGRKANDEDEDDKPKLTKEQKKQRERTNAGNLDNEKTEGNVVGVRCSSSDPEPKVRRGFISKPNETPYALIGTQDGVQQVVFTKGVKSKCKEIAVGDYLEAEGSKEHEQLFYADHDIDIRHR